MTPTKCPLCLRPFEQQPQKPWTRAAEQNGWQERGFTVFESGVNAATIAPGTSYEKRQPARAATVPSDVWVPALQSAISGGIAGVLGGSIAFLVSNHRPGAWGITVGAVGFSVSWLLMLYEHRRALWIIEKVTGRDLDDDGFVGEPAPLPSPPVRVEVSEVDDRGRLRRMSYIDLPFGVTDGMLEGIAIATQNGTAFSRRALGDVISADKFGKLRRAMLDGGLLRPLTQAENSAVELTPSGRAMMRQYSGVG
jgi:hypothetical protein